MRAGVYPNAGCLGRPWLLRLSSSQMDRGATQSSLCCAEGCVHGRPTAEGCVLAALCARSEWQAALMYAAEANAADMCKVLVAAEADLRGRTEGQLLFLLPG